jgi:hypothetical protein
MSSPFEKHLCDHKQVTQYICGVKKGESKNKRVPKYFADASSDCNMAEVSVQQDSRIRDTTPILNTNYLYCLFAPLLAKRAVSKYQFPCNSW